MSANGVTGQVFTPHRNTVTPLSKEKPIRYRVTGIGRVGSRFFDTVGHFNDTRLFTGWRDMMGIPSDCFNACSRFNRRFVLSQYGAGIGCGYVVSYCGTRRF